MNNLNLIVMTTAKATPGKEHDVQRALKDVALAARLQPDCVDYRVFQSTEDPATTINFEQWASSEARDTFLAGPDVEKFIAVVSGAFVESPQPMEFQEIA